VQTIPVPATVHAVLAARIDRLAPDDKRLLQIASVVGKDVPSVLLRSTSAAARCMPGSWTPSRGSMAIVSPKDKALTYLRQAGAKAFARSANHEAVGLRHFPEQWETIQHAMMCGSIFVMRSGPRRDPRRSAATRTGERLSDDLAVQLVHIHTSPRLLCPVEGGARDRETEGNELTCSRLNPDREHRPSLRKRTVGRSDCARQQAGAPDKRQGT
jgi:hypothetical protein